MCVILFIKLIFINLFTDVCASVQCGPNSECVSDNHVGVCHCREEYEGNASDLVVGCRPKPKYCSSSSECIGNCYEGICRRKKTTILTFTNCTIELSNFN